jgi:signal peptidase I
MFSFFKSDPEKELRKSAEALQQHIRKVWNYRRDALAPDVAERLIAARDRLTELFDSDKNNVDKNNVDKDVDKNAGEDARVEAVDEAHNALVAAGGRLYPSRLFPEWAELIVVAAIVACGFRSFFLQPFKIPTNSMWPTYSGMTCEVYPLDADGPSGLSAAWRKFRLLATRVEARARSSKNGGTGGEICIPLQGGNVPQKYGEGVDDGVFGIMGVRFFRGQVDNFRVVLCDPKNGNIRESIEVPVPKEFEFKSAVLKTFFKKEDALKVSEPMRWQNVIRNARQHDRIFHANIDGEDVVLLRTGHKVSAGERVANFDVLTGDLVLVERVSYNFVRPAVGDPFVFATENIPSINQKTYYIKRLVAGPGDTPDVEPPRYLLNGKPATGKVPFEKNNEANGEFDAAGKQLPLSQTAAAAHAAGYHGYTNLGAGNHSYLGQKVPSAHYFAMGDNSGNSHDSRAWGYVPEREIVGRGYFILYPFSHRWGFAE